MALGWDDAWEAALGEHDATLEPVRIVAEHRGAYEAMGRAEAKTAWVEVTGKAFHDAGDKRELPTVGDWVLVERWETALAGGGAAVIRAILPRRSLLVRRAAGEATAPQPLAANVDVGLVVTSANSDLSQERLDRYIGLLRDGGIEPVIVLSKLDLVDDPAPAFATVGSHGVRVLGASIVTGEGLAELAAMGGAGRTCVMLGSSGVGKSSLLNAMLGAHQVTREIRADQRGRHTTTRRELLVAPDGGVWIDTPGMRELAIWADEEAEAETEDAFDDIAELAALCKFRDCSHRDEPDCAVRGQVDPARLASFRKLSDERELAAVRQSRAKQIAETRKARSKKPPKDVL